MIKQKNLYILISLLAIIVLTVIAFQPRPPQALQQTNFHFQRNPLLSKILQGKKIPKPLFSLDNPGKEFPVDYSLYGEHAHLGNNKYKYTIKNPQGLKSALGSGIYPNTDEILKDNSYQYYEEYGLLDQFYWDSLTFEDWQKAFYLWTQAPENPGVKTFFTGYCLEKAGLIKQALKAYHATIVHFPRSVCWAKDQTFVWYVAQAALENIHRLCREYPELNLTLVDAYYKVTNGEDTNLKNDIIKVNPGKFIPQTQKEREARLPNLNKLSIINQRGKGKIKLIQYENGHWVMMKNNQPFYIHGITYNPTRVGLGPKSDPHFHARWMFTDKNNNRKIDAAYDSWIDTNKNGRKEPTDPVIGDFQLMKEMGINAIRLYVENEPSTDYDPKFINKELLRDLDKNYGIKTIVGDYLGAYTLGSGATWEDGTDYQSLEQKEFMKEVVRKKVMDLKDEPFVLMWLLGNENNMPVDYTGHNATRTNAAKYPVAYAQFLNEVAEMIHELDGNHPVAIGNIELDLLEVYQEHAPAIDIIGINSYRGSIGFGDLWTKAKEKFDRPILITEFGCDAYAQAVGKDEEAQLNYHKGKWEDIILNQAGGELTGSSIGGIIFEFLDEWWKDTFGHPYYEQQREAQFPLDFPDGFSHEEWFGIIGQGNGVHSPFQRELRKTYFYYKNLHNSIK